MVAQRPVAPIAVAFILLGTMAELHSVTATTAPCGSTWDELVMLQLPFAKKIDSILPAQVLSERVVSDVVPPAGNAAGKDVIVAVSSIRPILGCMFLIFTLSAIISLCFHAPLPWKHRGSKEKEKLEKTNLDSPPEQEKHCNMEKAEQSEGLEKTVAREYTHEAGEQKRAEAATITHEALPPGTGMCCCAAGIAKLAKPPPGSIPHQELADEQAANDTDPPYSQLTDTPSSSSRVPFSAPVPPPSCVKDGHANFSGTWACVKADGELDALLVDFGLSYLMRSAASAYAYGAGHISRTCEHDGSRMKYHETGFDGINTFEYDVPTTDVNMASHLRTVYWDEVQPHVLVVEAKDVEKAKPGTWSTSWQYLVDENTFHIKSRSRADHVATWTYKRQGV